MLDILSRKGLSFSIAVCLVSFGLLLWFAHHTYRKKPPISEETFSAFRFWLTIFVLFYAGWCAWRIWIKVLWTSPAGIPSNFINELATMALFWSVAPPLWFFVEYYGVANGRVTGRDNQASLESLRTFADYSSKIWAGVIALLLALVTLKGSP